MNFLLNAALAGRFTLQISKFNSKPTVIQGYLAKRQTDPWYRTDSRNKLTLTQSTDFQQRPQSNSIRKKVICTNGPETILKVKKKKKKKKDNTYLTPCNKNQFEINNRSKYKKSNYRAFNIKLKTN